MAQTLPEQGARPGRPARITRQAIAEAALTLGLDGLTLSAVARHLGVDHSSLYRHVSDRQELLLLAADTAILQLEWRTGDDGWRRLLERAAEAVWALYERYPGLAHAIRELGQTPPAGVRVFSETVLRLEVLGFGRDDAVLVLDSIMDMTVDSAIGWARIRSEAGGETVVATAMLQSWYRVSGGDPNIAEQVESMAAAMTSSPIGWWRRKLALILDGAERLAHGGKTPAK